MSKISVVGLGYVGLPLAVAFARSGIAVVGFDINEKRIAELLNGYDRTGEVSREEIAQSRVVFTSDPTLLGECTIIIVAVPTPVDVAKKPDLTILRRASEIVGKNMKKGTIVVFESTVYPGATEEECVPAIEHASGMRWKVDFNVGYSPERMNPGDKEHTVDTVIKIVSGDTTATLERVSALYNRICKAGIHEASSIKVAEAAKVIENVQRDINIALMNELSHIFHRLDIDTLDVLRAAGTKWNFMPFRPGLVGGHCIGVDPYYLTHKAEMLGHSAEVILAGRRINNDMGLWVGRQVVRELGSRAMFSPKTRVLIAGLTFKENVPDMRNSRVVDIYNELVAYGLQPMIWDPLADEDEIRCEYNIGYTNPKDLSDIDAYILAVPHAQVISEAPDSILNKLRKGALIFDLKGALDGSRELIRQKGLHYWRL